MIFLRLFSKLAVELGLDLGLGVYWVGSGLWDFRLGFLWRVLFMGCGVFMFLYWWEVRG